MDDRPGGTLVYRLLDRWMRVLARLVPEHAREAWRTEWDGELWYGVMGKEGGTRWRGAAGLARGLLRDALDVRRLEASTSTQRYPGVRGQALGSLVADVRYGLRMLRKTPGFTAVVVITLALGVGGAVTIFSVVDALLLSPLPYPDADRLVMMWQGRRAADVDKDWFSGGHFTDIKTQTRVFEELTFAEGGLSTLTGRGRPTEVGWVRAPSSYLRMLGAEVALGRIIDEQDDRADAARVALLTHGLWQQGYGGDADVVGRAITLNGRALEIVGVLSPDVLLDAEVMPTAYGNGRVDVVLSFPVTGETLSDRVSEGYNIVGKLASGATVAQAQVELDRLAAHIQELHESDPDSGFFIRAVPLLDEVVGSVRRPLVMLLASVGGVLLIACVNVANLLLARGGSRQRELGVRAAMGAERPRLVRQLLTESAVLAAFGGALGVGLASGGLRLVQRAGAASLPRVYEIGLDGRILVFALSITMVTCLVFGLVPAWRSARVELVDTLRPGGRTATAGGALWSRFNLSSALVIVEIALALVLLIGGGLLARSFMALGRVDPGFRAEGLLTFRVSLSGDAYAERVSRIAFFDALAERLAAVPGVQAVGGASHVPFDRGVSWGPMDIDDYVPPQGEAHQIITDFRVTMPGYFQAMGIPLIRGRVFDERDDLEAPEVAVIDETFARRYFPDRDPIGMRLVDGFLGTKATIIGVVGTVNREALDQVSRVTTYRPQGQWGWRRMYMVLSTSGDPETLVAPATRAVAEADPEVAVVDVLPMTTRVASSLAERRFSMALLQILGLVALTLAAVGVYGLVSYRVGQSTRELGLRMALGAPAGRILAMVLRHGLALAGVGVATGLVAALALTGFMRSMLFGVDAMDGWTYATLASGLALTVMIACYVPARRATRVNPLDAITGE
jgi:predicted permease